MQTTTQPVTFLTLEEALCTTDFQHAVDDIITLSPFVYDELEEEDKLNLLGTIVDVLKHDIADVLTYTDLDLIAKCVKNSLLFNRTLAEEELMDCYIKAIRNAYEPAIKEAYNDVYYRYSAQGKIEEEEWRRFERQDRYRRALDSKY